MTEDEKRAARYKVDRAASAALRIFPDKLGEFIARELREQWHTSLWIGSCENLSDVADTILEMEAK